jgi:hypothetical protein
MPLVERAEPPCSTNLQLLPRQQVSSSRTSSDAMCLDCHVADYAAPITAWLARATWCACEYQLMSFPAVCSGITSGQWRNVLQVRSHTCPHARVLHR